MLLSESLLNKIIRESIEGFLITEMLRNPPVPTNVRPIDMHLLTYHADQERKNRYKKLSSLYASRSSDNNCPFGKYIAAFNVNNRHSNGSEIHTITEFGVVIIQNRMSKEVVTFYQLRTFELDDYIEVLKVNGRLESRMLVAFTKAKACCKIYWDNEDMGTKSLGPGNKPSNPHGIKNNVVMRHRKKKTSDLGSDNKKDNNNI